MRRSETGAESVVTWAPDNKVSIDPITPTSVKPRRPMWRLLGADYGHDALRMSAWANMRKADVLAHVRWQTVHRSCRLARQTAVPKRNETMISCMCIHQILALAEITYLPRLASYES